MFKLENYITPILLSYVDRYIKNFRPEDSQVSLWGGDATFHNLDLRLEVLEQELQLPFTFVSGHIHELLIHVPWTKLASEPITVTINTIECILKLRGSEASSVNASSQTKERQKKGGKKQEFEPPPGYVQSLINKIVSNIKICCNNLILKYVEEDIVFSMNIKLLTFESVNQNWEPAYIDLSSSKVTLRKLINICDLTICLDKRNAAGKIDVYQEPVLYRCSLAVRFMRQYYTAYIKKASITRLDIHCSSMEFSMMEQQVPMLLRILRLLLALQQKELKPDPPPKSDVPTTSELAEVSEQQESWAGWAWSFVPPILPDFTYWDENWNEEETSNTGHTLHIGFYVDYASLTFKVSEIYSDRGTYYTQRKLKYLPLLTLRLQGLFTETVLNGLQWFHCTSGVSSIVLLPVGRCSCSLVELNGENSKDYFSAGEVSMTHKADSLFNEESPENKGLHRIYNTSWDFHMLTITESTLLERTPAFATDYLYQLELPEDTSSDKLSEAGTDLEYSNFHEKSLLRVVVGPSKLSLCSGFFHRISSLKVAASYYDYQPYRIPKSDPLLSELLPPCVEDFEALNENVSSRGIQLTILAPAIDLELFDHPHFEASKGNLYRRKNKLLASSSSSPRIDLPKITLECQCFDMKMQYPMYVNRLVQTVCLLPEPPQHMFDACYATKSLKILGFCGRLNISKKQTTIITPTSISYVFKQILKPQYWINPDIPHNEMVLESESITLTGTKPKLLLICYILDHFIRMDGLNSVNKLYKDTLFQDAYRSYGMPYLEISLEGVRFKQVVTNTTKTLDVNLDSIKAFIYEPAVEPGCYSRGSSLTGSTANTSCVGNAKKYFSTKDIQQVLFLSGPEHKLERRCSSKAEPSKALLIATLQFPLNPDIQPHPPLLFCNIQETRICVDPLLCRWLLYKPRPLKRNELFFFDPHQHKNRSISEASGSVVETPRKVGTPHESIHSSSEPSFIPLINVPQPGKQQETIDFQDVIHNFINKWFVIWKTMFLSIEISQCVIYFPLGSLSAIGSQGIQQAVDNSLKKKDPPEMFVVAVPLAAIFSATQVPNIAEHMTLLPVKLPSVVWSDKKLGFPWAVKLTDMSGYTLQNKHKLNFMKPLSVNVTIGISAKTEAKAANNDDSSSTDKNNELGSLGICMHVDMSCIDLTVSEVQMRLLTSIIYGLNEVISNLLPEEVIEMQKSPEVTQGVVGWESSLSPTIVRESTFDSVSDKASHVENVTETVENDGAKLSAWIQWTIARFRITLLSHDIRDLDIKHNSYLYNPNMKLIMDVEDIVSSVDFQNVYLKVKTKIASINVQHFKKRKVMKNWNSGEFMGLVMRTTEENAINLERQEDAGFLTITLTRASCQHTHALWGTVQKHKLKEKANSNLASLLSPSRYITEIVINSQSIDFVLSMLVLRSFCMVFEPLITLSTLTEKSHQPTNAPLVTLNNRDLPLIYLDCQTIRFYIPCDEINRKDLEYDVFVFQVETIKLVPSAVNPICRTPCRPDIYQLAAQSRILSIPGSEIEDRQYQLDVTGVCLSSSTWEEVNKMLTAHPHLSLKTMSENPALEWNNMDKGKLGMTPNSGCLWPIINKFDVSIIVAPAIIFKDHTLICGHSVEFNFVTDIEINVSLSQIKLAAVLCGEFFRLFKFCLTEEFVVEQNRIVLPYQRFDAAHLNLDEEEWETNDFNRDSGIETSEQLSIHSIATMTTSATQTEFVNKRAKSTDSKSSDRSICGAFPRPPNSLPSQHQNIPVDILITGGKISASLYRTSEVNNKLKMLKSKRFSLFRDSDPEKGYEASEEGSVDENVHAVHASSSKLPSKCYQPLLLISASQPNAFLSRFYLGRKVQLSCFDVSIKISESEHVVCKNIPVESNYSINLLETKPGMPHPNTGILPAFFTLKWSRGLSKPASIEIEIARPTQILCSVNRWNYLLSFKERLFNSLYTSMEAYSFYEIHSSFVTEKSTKTESSSSSNNPHSNVHKLIETYTKFKDIKQKLCGVSNLNVKFLQVVLLFKTENVPELNLSIGKLSTSLSISNRPERLINTVAFESLTLGISKEDSTNLLLNPWSINVEVNLFWEVWQSLDSDPQIRVSIKSDCIMLDVSYENIKCVEMVSKDMLQFFADLNFGGNSSNEKPYRFNVSSADKEQYYKDDLKAGAFQFIDANLHNSVDNLPLPYQVIFWNKPTAAMAWRYPQPRALTKIRVFPVPFKTASYDEDYQVLCNLEYWSECHGHYRPYIQFQLSESEISHLEMPDNCRQTVACIWRVVLTIQSDSPKANIDKFNILISPRALAACLRIDSYFNKVLVPDLTLALDISNINVSLNNSVDKSTNFDMPKTLKLYTFDMLIPDKHCFLTLGLRDLKVYVATWNFDSFSFDMTTTTSCSVLDYSFLTWQPIVEPFESKIEVDLVENISVNFMSKPIGLKFGPSIAHTLAVSLQMWEQNRHAQQSKELIIVTRYVLCNNTNINVCFGQVFTDEQIYLAPRHCHLYTWRTQKSKQAIRLGIENKDKDHDWLWSKPFLIDSKVSETPATEICEFSSSGTNYIIFVTIKNLSTTQRQITFTGQVIICNMLLEHFELKLVPNVESSEDKEREFKRSQSHLIHGSSTPPSHVINSNKTHHIRLRFYGLESSWSGDIPLFANPKCAQPWLVKVPLQERGQFLSIWVRIVTQNFTNRRTQMMAIFWPLFMVRSNLPISAKVQIETPTLNVHIESNVRGKGEAQQLYCPGTIDHSHQLSFQIDSSSPTSNPYVPLNYSLVDQKDFFKKLDKENISELLETLENFGRNDWPYFEDLENIDWITEEQPLTHVQVRYQNACLSSSALLVELLPWSLTVNMLGCPIAIIVNEKVLAKVNHHGIITTPKLEETFYIGVGVNGTWNVSLPLQLVKPEWSQTFYMPTITGNIPVDGVVNTAVLCNRHICMVSINSKIVNEMRLLRVTSSHVLVNHMSIPVEVVCLAVAEGKRFSFPKDAQNSAYLVPPSLNKIEAGIAITQWFLLEANTDVNGSFALYISVSLNGESKWSCPVRVDKGLVRRSICVSGDNRNVPVVVIFQQNNGQTYLSLHEDSHSQIHIENKCGVKLYFAQYNNDESKDSIVSDCEHFDWVCSLDSGSTTYYTMPGYCEKFPNITPNNFSEMLVMAADSQDGSQNLHWSTPVCVTNSNTNHFVKIPTVGDVKISITLSVYTVFVVVDSASQVEINAQDIRVRLFLHENESSSIKKIKEAESLDVQTEYFLMDKSVDVESVYYSSASVAQEPSPSVTSSSQSIALETTSVVTSYGFRTLPTLEEQSTSANMLPVLKTQTERLYQSNSNTSVNNALTFVSPTYKSWTNLKVSVFLNNINLTLISDLNPNSRDCTELTDLCIDDVVLITNQTSDVIQSTLTVGKVQLDNQMYSNGGFDFPVVLVRQDKTPNLLLTSLNTSIRNWISIAQRNPLLRFDFDIESCSEFGLPRTVGVKTMKITVQPLLLYVEDAFVMSLIDYLTMLSPNKLVVLTKRPRSVQFDLSSNMVRVPQYILWGGNMLAQPITLQCLSIDSFSLLISVHYSIKMYIALDQSPLQFNKFEHKRLYTTPYRLGHALTMHYFYGALFGAGWVVGSLELLGSPGGLARAMGNGLYDFVNLPYQGLIQGPWAFLRGVTHGSASLMKHITAGTLQSVTKLASSVARNLDRLTMDEEHFRRTEEMRRQKPQGFTQGFVQGLTGLGISLLGAVGGIAHHPIQSVMSDGASPRGLAAGVGLGLVGVFTKPLSGAAELVALTGEGLLQGAGWSNLPEPRKLPVQCCMYSSSNSILKYKWKYAEKFNNAPLLFVTDATIVKGDGQYGEVNLLLTTDLLVIINTDQDSLERIVNLSQLVIIDTQTDPSRLKLKIKPSKPPSVKMGQDEGGLIEMDPVCRARVADYVRNTFGVVAFPDNASPHSSDISILSDPLMQAENDQAILIFYLNPQRKNYFINIVSLANQQKEKHSFCVF